MPNILNKELATLMNDVATMLDDQHEDVTRVHKIRRAARKIQTPFPTLTQASSW